MAVVEIWDSGTEAQRLFEKTTHWTMLARTLPLSRGINIMGNERSERD